MNTINTFWYLKLKARRKKNLIFPSYPSSMIGLAEFPKSGMTMFKMGLAVLFKDLNRAPDRVTWFNQNLIIPDEHTAGRKGDAQRLSFLKTHNVNDFSFNSVIPKIHQ